MARDGLPPLHFAVKTGVLQIVRILIENGAYIRARYGFEQTALNFAVESGHAGIVRLLVEHGARDPVEKTAVRLVFENGHRDMGV
jgi:ankyrin repeat protein